MAEVQAQFASTTHSSKRRRIFAALRQHLGNPLVSDLAERVLVDGGFVSSKPEPKDADIVLGLVPGTMEALLAGRLGVDPVAAIPVLEGKLSEVVDGHRMLHGWVDDVGGPKYEGMRRYLQKSDRVSEPPAKGILVLELK